MRSAAAEILELDRLSSLYALRALTMSGYQELSRFEIGREAQQPLDRALDSASVGIHLQLGNRHDG